MIERSDPVVIHCDESGFAGGNLVGRGHSTVFAHASLQVDAAVAAAAVQTFRSGVGAADRGVGGDGEYKSAELMRPRHRRVLLDLLAADGPLPGHARIHLTDTRLFTLARLGDVLLGRAPVRATDVPGREPEVRVSALLLHARGGEVFGVERWGDFLATAGTLLRTRKRWATTLQPLEAFSAALDDLAGRPAPPAVRSAVDELTATRPAALAWRALQLDRPRPTPLVEPLIPAVMCAIVAWGRLSGSVEVFHDEQSVLTPRRIAELARTYADDHPRHRLIGLHRVDSRRDVRIQLADLVAGAALRLARDALAGRPDPEGLALLRPLLDEASLWPGELPGSLDQPPVRAGR